MDINGLIIEIMEFDVKRDLYIWKKTYKRDQYIQKKT